MSMKAKYIMWHKLRVTKTYSVLFLEHSIKMYIFNELFTCNAFIIANECQGKIMLWIQHVYLLKAQKFNKRLMGYNANLK